MNSNNYDITCSTEDTCIIHCESTDACGTINLNCNGICYLDCDEDNDFNCPMIDESNNIYKFYSTSTPTGLLHFF